MLVVNRGPKPETKKKNTSIIHAASTQSTTLPTAIAAGAGPAQRVGRKIRVKALEVCLQADAGSGPIRVVLYVPKSAPDTISLTAPSDQIDNDGFWVVRDFWVNPNDNGVAMAHRMVHRFPIHMLTEYENANASGTIRNNLKLQLFSANSTNINGHTKVWYLDN